jgi:CrcB protein
MSLAELIGVGLLGGLGALARFALDGGLSRRLTATEFPFGTLAVNILGSFVVGVFAGGTLRGSGYLLLATGFVGAFTTFSTWTLESHRVAEDGRSALAVANIAVSLVLGVLAVWAGRHLGVAL